MAAGFATLLVVLAPAAAGPQVARAVSTTTPAAGTSAAGTSTAGQVAVADSTGTGLSAWATCVKGTRQGDLLVLMDATQSLLQSDPDGARARAVQFLLRQLQAVTQDLGSGSGEAPADIQVAFADFGTDYQLLSGWRGLSDPATDAMARSFAQRDNQPNTDYVMALEGARRQLQARREARQASGATQSCQALVWVSDGQYSLESGIGTPTRPYATDADLGTPAGANAAVAAGTRMLCRPGGTVDAVRGDRVATLAIGLGGTAADFRLFQSMAAGSSCGSVPPLGDFFRADHLEDMLLAIDQSFHGDSAQPERICAAQDESCPGRQFVLDDSIRSFRTFSVVNRDGLRVDLVPPSADPTDPQQVISFSYPGAAAASTTSQQRTFGDLVVDFLWDTPKALSLRVTRPGGGDTPIWAGQWAIRLVDPAATSSGGQGFIRLVIRGDRQPYRVDRQVLHAGSTATLQFGVQDLNGHPVDLPTVQGTLRLDVDLIDSAGATRHVLVDAGKDTLNRAVPVNLSGVALGPAQLRMTLQVTTAGAVDRKGQPVPGTRLGDEVVPLQVNVLAPASYPQVPEQDVGFGTLADGRTRADASVRVTGNGCVWVTGGTARTQPTGVSRVTVAGTVAGSRQTCQKVEGGATVPVRLDLDHPGYGPADGTLVVHALPSDGSGQAAETALAYHADAETPVAVGRFVLALVIALLVGLGVPALVWVLLARWAGRMPEADLTILIHRIGADGTSAPSPGPKVETLSGRLRRSFTIDVDRRHTVLVIARPSWWGQEGKVALRAAGAAQVVVVDRQGRASVGRQARLPLALVGSWFAVGDGVSDYTVAFLRSRSTAQEQTALSEAVRTGEAAALQALRAPQQPSPAGVAGAPHAAGPAPAAAAHGGAPAADPWASDPALPGSVGVRPGPGPAPGPGRGPGPGAATPSVPQAWAPGPERDSDW